MPRFHAIADLLRRCRRHAQIVDAISPCCLRAMPLRLRHCLFFAIVTLPAHMLVMLRRVSAQRYFDEERYAAKEVAQQQADKRERMSASASGSRLLRWR